MNQARGDLVDVKKIIQHHPIICGVLLLLVLWFCYGDGNHGTGTFTVGSQLESIGSQQQEITRRSEEAEKRIDSIDCSIRESAEIIADCKRILAEVRKRNESQTTQN